MEGWRDGGMEGWRDGGMEGGVLDRRYWAYQQRLVLQPLHLEHGALRRREQLGRVLQRADGLAVDRRDHVAQHQLATLRGKPRRVELHDGEVPDVGAGADALQPHVALAHCEAHAELLRRVRLLDDNPQAGARLLCRTGRRWNRPSARARCARRSCRRSRVGRSDGRGPLRRLLRRRRLRVAPAGSRALAADRRRSRCCGGCHSRWRPAARFVGREHGLSIGPKADGQNRRGLALHQRRRRFARASGASLAEAVEQAAHVPCLHLDRGCHLAQAVGIEALQVAEVVPALVVECLRVRCEVHLG